MHLSASLFSICTSACDSKSKRCMAPVYQQSELMIQGLRPAEIYSHSQLCYGMADFCFSKSLNLIQVPEQPPLISK